MHSPPHSPPFPFPKEYHFPPFFTLQPNLTTRYSQLRRWTSLLLSFAQHHRIFRLSPSDPAAAPLFHNTAIARRLAPDAIVEVLRFACRKGRAEPVLTEGGGGGGGGGRRRRDGVFWIYWRTPAEWAEVLDRWVEQTAQEGVVFTLFELTEGEATEGTEFHGMDPELLRKALNVLVKRGKAQIFGSEESPGVKFFRGTPQ